ncbi:hypothetical protein BCV69DRAFT_55469 [Microstroma glucosiphilum]|uniref:Rad21/Rec8-like protein C-terminal eukaryotic domain-containing protein n=1 Tax=Pseudomicrostroma glucosiphilum TaxID=1684307 RepID=A0A316U2F2_9BASI|nr:hypothetical protein BCV69DRAFT_55469 [Pseudomicrostroma glucosiphilum]PWN18998.1 hypothetical protein BCV69DRAFT_55469 [Pseudomicrostroma glucosiphilum]
MLKGSSEREADVGHLTLGSIRGDRTPRSHRSLSVGSISAPVLGRHGSVALPSPARETEYAHEAEDLAQGDEGDQMIEIYDSQAAQSEFHKETQNFFNFAKRIAVEVQPEPLFFSDLAPVADSMPTVAAQAFYHLLQLATNQEVQVQQDEAYGEVRVVIPGTQDLST